MSLPQREGRPSLDLSPYSIPDKAGWTEKFNEPVNECNAPWPERKGKPEPHGWSKEAYDVNHDHDV